MMFGRVIVASLAGVLAFSAVPTLAQVKVDAQGLARKELRAGTVRPLREIEARVVPTMPGMQYLGPEYDPAAMVYRLKFIAKGRVVFVDVDARTGLIIARN